MSTSKVFVIFYIEKKLSDTIYGWTPLNLVRPFELALDDIYSQLIYNNY